MTGRAVEGEPGWTLAIEISNPSARPPEGAGSDIGPGVAGRIGVDGPIVVERLRGAKRLDDDVMPAIERLRSRLGVRAMSLDRVVVSLGPGGYTALRVATTTARALSLASGASLVGVPSAAVVAAGVAPSKRPLLVCLASKRGAAVATVFEGEITQGRSIGLIDGTWSEPLTNLWVAADHHLPPPLAACFGKLGGTLEFPSISARNLLLLGDCFPVVPASSIIPVYGREPEAVRRWRERFPT